MFRSSDIPAFLYGKRSSLLGPPLCFFLVVSAIEYVYVRLSRQTNFLLGWVRVTFWWLDCLFRETTEFISVTERKFEAILLSIFWWINYFMDRPSFFSAAYISVVIQNVYTSMVVVIKFILYTGEKTHTHKQSLKNQLDPMWYQHERRNHPSRQS